MSKLGQQILKSLKTFKQDLEANFSNNRRTLIVKKDSGYRVIKFKRMGMQPKTVLQIETLIIFIRDIIYKGDEVYLEIVMASKGDKGRILKHEEKSDYWVEASEFDGPFLVSHGVDFIVIDNED